MYAGQGWIRKQFIMIYLVTEIGLVHKGNITEKKLQPVAYIKTT